MYPKVLQQIITNPKQQPLSVNMCMCPLCGFISDRGSRINIQEYPTGVASSHE